MVLAVVIALFVANSPMLAACFVQIDQETLEPVCVLNYDPYTAFGRYLLKYSTV